MICTNPHTTGEKPSPGIRARQGIFGAFLFTSLLGLSSLTTVAHADAFGAGDSSKDVLVRLEALETQIKELGDTPNGVAAKAASGSEHSTADVREPAEILAEKDIIADQFETSYEYLGRLNGLNVVKFGAKNLLLTDLEYESFTKERMERVTREVKLGMVDGSTSLKLPDPPSVGGSSVTQAKAPTPVAVKVTSAGEPVKKTARERMADRKKAAAEAERKEKAAKTAKQNSGYRAQTTDNGYSGQNNIQN